MDMFELVAMLLKMLFVLAVVLNAVPIVIWFERRGSAWIQGRVGPNRVGPFGLMQPVADVIKFIFKEDFVPAQASKFYYHFAPMVAAVAPFAAFAAIPFGSYLVINGQNVPLQIATLDIGVLAVLAFIGLEIYPMMLAGWASNNKYSIFGALRGSSQMVSYEIAMGLSLVSMLTIYGTLDMGKIVAYQEESLWGFIPHWGFLLNPVAFIIFLVSIFAETNRLPFDMPEGDSEIVAGYHTEYGATKFAMFFFAEYVAMIAASCLLITLFFGGYALFPGMKPVLASVASALQLGADGSQNLLAVAQTLVFIFKVTCVMFLFVWVRWTFPRFRFDQLMHLGWKIFFPLALFNLVFVAIVIAVIGG
jgi:NADH-quinone oxidoreductase subunit H